MNRIRSAAVVLTLSVLALGGALFGYIRTTVTGDDLSPFLFQPQPDSIQFFVEDVVAADLRNADNRPVISPSSDPLAALEAALDTWSDIPDSALHFNPLQPTAAANDPFDGVNVIVFSDTPEVRSLTVGALVSTVLRFEPDGRITDADILFNPNIRPGNNQIPFATDLALNTVDLQGAATHALGQALGAGKNPVVGSALYPFVDFSTPLRRRLSSDDVAFARQAYPSSDAPEDLAEITGLVAVDGEPAGGVLVTAVDPDRGVLISALTDLDDGTYRIQVPAAPQGRYLLYVESLDGPVTPRDIQEFNVSKFHTTVRPRFFGGNTRPLAVDVIAGSAAEANFNVEAGDPVLEIERIGVDEPGGSGPPLRLTSGPIELVAGRAYDILLLGRGIDRGLGIGDIRLLVPGVRIREGSVRVDPNFTFNGGPVVRITVDVDPRRQRHTGSIIVLRSRAMDAYTGALLIEPAAPELAADGVVNAASFVSEGVAPGMIVSIFGSALGPPPPGLEAGDFDPATGKLRTKLGDVAVTFNGVRAPLFFVSDGQLNVQAPFEISGLGSVKVVAHLGEAASLPVNVEVAPAQPGLFTITPGGDPIIALLPNGSLSSPANPVERGQFVTLFATGAGELTNAPETGAPAPADPLSRAAGLTVELGGVQVAAAELLFAGLTPGFVGLLQINLRIAADSPTGDAVGVRIRIAGRGSQPGATLAIR